MRRSAVLALSLVLAVGGAAESLGTPEPGPSEVGAYASKRNGCGRLFTRQQFRGYAREKFRERVYSNADRRRVRTRAVCQRSDRDQRWAFRLRAQMRAARYHRTHRLCATTTCNARLLYFVESRRSSPSEGRCLRTLSFHESGWDELEWNDSGSGAYGLGQALPPSKMAPYGPDHMTNPLTQVRWMMAYVRDRYGSACGALAFFYANNWY